MDNGQWTAVGGGPGGCLRNPDDFSGKRRFLDDSLLRNPRVRTSTACHTRRESKLAPSHDRYSPEFLRASSKWLTISGILDGEAVIEVSLGQRTTECSVGGNPAAHPRQPRACLQALSLDFSRRISTNANLSPDIASSVSSRHRRRGSRGHSAAVGQPGLRLSVAERPSGLCDDRPAQSGLGDHQQVVRLRRFRRPGRRRCEGAGRQRREGRERPGARSPTPTRTTARSSTAKTSTR